LAEVKFNRMLLSVADLALHARHVEHDFAAGEVAIEHPDIDSIGPLHVVADAKMVGPTISLHLSVDGEVKPHCARCLEPVILPLKRHWDLVYHPVSELAPEEDVEIQTAETEVGFFRGEGVELEDVIREQVLLSLPMRTICREECRGICPVCGQNLNTGQCGCVRLEVDERWRALADLSKRKEREGHKQ
jgi:uncharacterized protein